jgi:hypothetical protein
MQDRPTCDELLAAVEAFLDAGAAPGAEAAMRFHARVAANAVRIVRRELALEDAHLDAELARLQDLLGPATAPATEKAGRLEATDDTRGQPATQVRQPTEAAAPSRATGELRTTIGKGLEFVSTSSTARSAAARRRLIVTATEALCERIRRGDADAPPFRDRVIDHVRATVRAKLEVTNPRWIGGAE